MPCSGVVWCRFLYKGHLVAEIELFSRVFFLSHYSLFWSMASGFGDGGKYPRCASGAAAPMSAEQQGSTCTWRQERTYQYESAPRHATPQTYPASDHLPAAATQPHWSRIGTRVLRLFRHSPQLVLRGSAHQSRAAIGALFPTNA